ncbi:hypothetical protein T10_11340 [Trichinella papuae]|uniref:Uncharacterized protein n=1 Tax=Trichinella papuae TaxID=268474 RepID=A0A0V1MH85_9BILA|nr:hypothetical protein T10_11340 [Trichinella papuae]
MCPLDSGCQQSLIRKKIVDQIRSDRIDGAFELADQFPRPAAKIDVLIGMDFYNKFTTNEMIIRRGENEPYALETPFGWILSAPISSNVDEGTCAMGIEEPPDEVSKTSLFLKDSIIYDGNRYVVELPWINNSKMLPDNFKHALARLQQTERTMSRDPDIAIACRKSLKEYLDDNIIKEIDQDNGNEGKIWYLPHRMVVRKDNSTKKYRIVFDGSARYKGISLNEHLDAGPALQSDMVSLLHRFGVYSIAVQADITKMFLHIGLNEKDLIRHHAELKKQACPDAAQIVENNIYVDDVLLSIVNQEAARRVIKDLNNLMESGGEKDEFTFVSLNIEDEKNCTRRKLISDASKLFDPLGFLTPFVVQAKILFQKLCQADMDWDESLLSSIAQHWKTNSIELHVYGDASKWAYETAAYLKIISEDKKIVRDSSWRSRDQIVLSWIRSEARNWKLFVRNRVELTQQLTEPKLWKYCPSESNPVDLISRETSITKLKDCRLWWEGLPSLLNPESCWSQKTSEEISQHPEALKESSLLSDCLVPLIRTELPRQIESEEGKTNSRRAK